MSKRVYVATMTVEIGYTVKIGAEAIQCSCGGYAKETKVTEEEDNKYGCGRSNCCSVAFCCMLCGNRLVGSSQAPEC